MRTDSRSKPKKISAGSVKMTPDAMDWPALPTVCTMLFSRIDALPKARRMEIDSTEMGNRRSHREPGTQTYVDRDGSEEHGEHCASNSARKVNSGRVSEAGTKGWKFAGAGMLVGLSPWLAARRRV